MRSRRGVTLVEVLVAAILAAVGVGGALHTLVTAARFRDRASRREAVARTVEARLGWFALGACTAPDTVVHVATDGVDETWSIARSGAAVRLEGRAIARVPGRTVRLALVHERRCP